MQFKKIFLTGFFLALFSSVLAQKPVHSSLIVRVTDSAGQALSGANLKLDGLGKESYTDTRGLYTMRGIIPGVHTLTVSKTGFKTFIQTIEIRAGQQNLTIKLQERLFDLQSVNITGQTAAQSVRLQPFAVAVVDARKLAERDVELNRLLDGQSGIRVQESGGLGSEFAYSIHGLSGKAVKFFIDGIPMESFGTSFSINNFPANIVDRIEVYKGVTPVEMGGDALGGAINLVSRRDIKNYLDISQSYGSFNTSRSALSGRWRHRSGFTVQANSFYNYSDNNYEVWGPTVEIAGADGRPLPGYPRFRRFNDDYRAYTVRAEAGFSQVGWADQLMFGLTYADQHRGIQTGRTMAFVYGDVRYREDFLMPSLRYSRRGFFTKNLDVDLFASVNRLHGTTVDTSSNKYNWNGEVIGVNANGELGGIRASRSVYSFRDKTTLARINLNYRLPGSQRLTFNYGVNNTSRKGSDAISTAEWTIPFRFPQDMNKQTAGLSYEVVLLEEKLSSMLFVKHFAYRANATVHDFNGGAARETFYRNTKDHAWGIGYAGKYTIGSSYLLKFSAENTSRLPEASELLGNGNTILNAPGLEPERSTNLNASLHKTISWDASALQVSAGTFFRDTRNLIWLGEGDLMGTSRYTNLGRIRTIGAELEISYRHNKWLEASANATYQDIRNRQRYEATGAPNHVYNDRLRNTPYFMTNGEVRVYLDQPLRLKERLTFYVNSHYVQRYYLGWPSLGAPKDKLYIPSQFVQDAGLSYVFRQSRYSANLGVRNIFDKQVYDNYLLQKPGRYVSVKLRYFLQ